MRQLGLRKFTKFMVLRARGEPPSGGYVYFVYFAAKGSERSDPASAPKSSRMFAVTAERCSYAGGLSIALPPPVAAERICGRPVNGGDSDMP